MPLTSANKQILLTLNNLTHLAFGDYFDLPIDSDIFPPSLLHLGFGQNFNQPIKNLPPKITHLYFGEKFNQQLRNIPKTVTHLGFGYLFEQSVEFPPKIAHLTIGPKQLLTGMLIQIYKRTCGAF